MGKMTIDELMADPEIAEMVDEIEWCAWLLRLLEGKDNNRRVK